MYLNYKSCLHCFTGMLGIALKLIFFSERSRLRSNRHSHRGGRGDFHFSVSNSSDRGQHDLHNFNRSRPDPRESEFVYGVLIWPSNIEGRGGITNLRSVALLKSEGNADHCYTPSVEKREDNSMLGMPQEMSSKHDVTEAWSHVAIFWRSLIMSSA